jgi:hypothetical protein
MLEAFRAADFILNHLAAADELARRWSRAEITEATVTQSTKVTGTGITEKR